MPAEASRESPKREPKVSSADSSSPAAIIARRAWSSYRIGTLKRAITASPMYLSIKAPCLTNTSVAIRKKASMTSCVLSAPRSWVSSVNDDRSAKSTVISSSRPSSTWALQRVQMLGLRGLRRIPKVRNTILMAPDNSVPQTLHCAES